MLHSESVVIRNAGSMLGMRFNHVQISHLYVVNAHPEPRCDVEPVAYSVSTFVNPLL